MALDQGGIFRCELLHVSQCFDAETARAKSMHCPACMPVGSDGRQNGLLTEMEAERAWDLLKVHDGSVHDIAARLLAERKIDLTGYVLTTLTAP